MAPQDDLHFWLWIATMATALIGGLLAMWGARLQRCTGAESGATAASRVMLASYVLMTVSMLLFAARGFI